jgi:hypothetical protein
MNRGAAEGRSAGRRLPLWITRGAIIALTVVGAVACLVVTTPDGTVLYLAYVGIGAYLAVRRPDNAIAWLMIIVGCGLATGSVNVPADADQLLSGDLDPTQVALAWTYGWGWSLVMMGFLGITLVFPSGRLPQGRGRWASRVAIGGIIVLAVLMAIGPTLTVLPGGSTDEIVVPNPLALFDPSLEAAIPPPTPLFTMMFGIVLAGFVTMFARFRRSTGFERLQYRWLLSAVGVVVAGTITWVTLTQVLEVSDHGLLAVAVVILTYTAVPIAIGVAVLRYRLYEIDRLISRTIGWAVVTALLVGTFAGLVLGLQAVLADVTQGATLAVAASTLVAFALFAPVRSRVQGAVDRRFDRSRYDGERLLAEFGERLRDEVDLVTISRDARATVDAAVRPTSVGLWLRGGSEGEA